MASKLTKIKGRMAELDADSAEGVIEHLLGAPARITQVFNAAGQRLGYTLNIDTTDYPDPVIKNQIEGWVLCCGAGSSVVFRELGMLFASLISDLCEARDDFGVWPSGYKREPAPWEKG